MGDVVLGIDLSLVGLGLCAIPTDWDLNMKRVRAVTLTYPLPKGATTRQLMERLRALSLDVRTFAIRVGARMAWIESYAYSMSSMAHSLGELGGVVKLELWRECGLDVQIANQSSARKLMYGRMPPRGMTQTQRKGWLLEPLKLAGAPVEDHNQGDALVVANYGLSELGAPCLAQLLGLPEEKPKRKRARAA
jgi:hypothetical protein